VRKVSLVLGANSFVFEGTGRATKNKERRRKTKRRKRTRIRRIRRTRRTKNTKNTRKTRKTRRIRRRTTLSRSTKLRITSNESILQKTVDGLSVVEDWLQSRAKK
jgi:hypothetical protein